MATDPGRNDMRTRTIVAFLVLVGMAAVGAVQAEAQTTTQKSLSSTMEVYVFPTEGQDASQQSIDEAECYQWANENTRSPRPARGPEPRGLSAVPRPVR
jgi:hypothetical protein